MQYPMIAQPQYAFAPTMMAAGGAVDAENVRSQGRGNDTMLVHMTPREVGGLQALAMAHGGSLSINPNTGLPEAGFLDSIVPVIAGAGLMAATGGAATPLVAGMSNAALIGMGVGGATALMTGDLKKGLMAGLGAYGGAGLGSGLMAAGAPSTAGTPVTASTQLTATATPQAPIVADVGYIPPVGSPAAAPSPAMLAPPPTVTPPTFAQNIQRMGTGVKNLLTPENAGSAFKNLIGSSEQVDKKTGEVVAKATGMGGLPGAVKTAGAIVAPVVAEKIFEEDKGLPKPKQEIRPYSIDMKPSAETDKDFQYRTGTQGESTAELKYFEPTYTALGVYEAGTEPGPSFYGTPTNEDLKRYYNAGYGTRYAASGGIVALAKGGLKDGGFVVPADVVAHLGNGSSDAGQKILAKRFGARQIKGKGDGMSDSIPTKIDGKQPARVADGEAYIPPEKVKKVGAKRLYAMMDKIRQDRTGTKAQAPQINPRKYIPA